MAIYDTRVFRTAPDSWWVGQVHGGSGGVRWGEAKGPFPLVSEMVLFSCVSDKTMPTRSISMSAGMLNRMSHRSILSLLSRAKPWTSGRFNISPANFPDPDALASFREVADPDGERLRWIIRPSNGIRASRAGAVKVDGIEVLCLDDSALRREVFWDDDIPYAALSTSTQAFEMAKALIGAVKDLFEDYKLDSEHDLEYD
jgi:hypothetical protein